MKNLLCAAAFAICLPVHAGVVWNWQSLSGDPEGRMSGRVEVTHSAYRAGSLSYHYDGSWNPHYFPGRDIHDLNSPVLELALWWKEPDPNHLIAVHGVNNRFRDGGTGFEDARDSWANFVFGPLLLGGFTTGGNGVDITVESDPLGFATVTTFYGRYAGLIAGGDNGPVITGQWVLDEQSIPLPSTLPLFGAGLLALIGLQKRGKRTTADKANANVTTASGHYATVRRD